MTAEPGPYAILALKEFNPLVIGAVNKEVPVAVRQRRNDVKRRNKRHVQLFDPLVLRFDVIHRHGKMVHFAFIGQVVIITLDQLHFRLVRIAEAEKRQLQHAVRVHKAAFQLQPDHLRVKADGRVQILDDDTDMVNPLACHWPHPP